MVRFSDWLAVESFVDSVDLNTARKRAFVETMTEILRIINEGLDEGEEEGSETPEGEDNAKPVFQDEMLLKGRDEHLKSMLEALKLIRKNAMAQRAQKVEKIRKLQAAHSSDMDDDADLADALPDLVDLGYLKPAQANKIRQNIDLPESDPKNKKAWEALEEKAHQASTEQGNGSMSMMQDEETEIEEAKKKLYDAIIGAYRDKIERRAARNQRFAGDGVGHQHYEESEIADEMFTYILSLVSQRRWQDGELLPWGGGQPVVMDDGTKKKQRGQGIEEILKSSGDEKDLERMYAYFSSSVKSTATKMRRAAGSQLNPSSRGRVKSDIHTNKDKKAKQINDDVRNGDLDFYREYLKKANEKPLDQRSEDEEIVMASTAEDKTRLAIMKAIEYEYTYRPSSRELFSMKEDDQSIKKTLLNYITSYLRRGEKSVTHASTIVGDRDSSSDDVLSGVKAAFKKHDEPPEASNPMDSAEDSESIGSRKLIFDFFLPYIVESINEISKEGLKPSTEGLFVFDKQPKMNGKVKVYVPGGIDEATMNSINTIIDSKLKQEGDPAPERSRYKKLSAESANSYRVHESILNQFLQVFKTTGKKVDLESASGAPGLESFGSKGNRGASEALALCIKFGIPCSIRTEIRRGEIVPLDISAQAEQSTDPSSKEYMATIFKDRMKKGWDWDAFCREAFKNYGLNSYQAIAEKWIQYPPGSNQKLSPRNLRSMAEYLEGTPTMSSEGGLIKLCNKMAEKIKF